MKDRPGQRRAFLGGAIMLLGSVALMAGCSYSFKSTLPEHVKTLSIDVFDNETMEIGLEGKVSDKIVEEFALDGRVKVSDYTPDARLEGKIVKYDKRAINYGSDDGIYEFRMNIEVEFSCKDLKTGENLAGPMPMKTSLDYQVFGSLASSEKDAQEELAGELAKEIVHEVLMGW